MLVLAAATSFNGFDKSPVREGRDEAALVERQVAAAAAQSWDELRAAHVSDHRSLMGRVTLDLGATTAKTDLPTDERIATLGATDPQLVTMLFDYGRYLLVASSRPGTQPANLQGIWNDQVRPPWSSNWTVNINTEMNYWPAETANLAELHEPLISLVEDLSITGAKTAATNYGARGWTAHHNADLWRQSAPVGNYGDGDPVWALWPMAGPWLAQHLWEHYAFGGDRAYLRTRAYPVMAGAAEFCLDWLVDNGHGQLVTAPSTSPEHKFVLPDGTRAAVTQAASMDLALVWDLFRNLLQADAVLGTWHASFRQARSCARAVAAVSHQLRGRAAGMGRRLSACRARASPLLTSVRVVPRAADHAGDAGALRRRAPIAGAAGRRRHGLESGLEGQRVGAAPRWRPRVQVPEEPAQAGRGEPRRTLRGRRRVRESLRRASAVPDRRQLRRGRGHRRDARAEPRRTDRSAAGAAFGLALGSCPGTASARRIRVGPRLGRAPGRPRDDPIAAGRSVPRANAVAGDRDGRFAAARRPGRTPIPFYRVHPVADPIVAPGAVLGTLPPIGGNVIEFETGPGRTYELRA